MQFSQWLNALADALEQMQAGRIDVTIPPSDDASLTRLARAGASLLREQKTRHLLDQTFYSVNTGLQLNEVLNNIYNDFRSLIPYNRIGVAFITEDNRVRAHWARSDQPTLRIKGGYSAPLAGSSLEEVLINGQPRIINDLPAYLEAKPQSDSTRLIVAEGMQASLTCPLRVEGMPVGFIFFSSIYAGIYTSEHAAIFNRLADHVAVMVEKSRLISEIMAQQSIIAQHNAALEEAGRMKDTFLGIAAHDLRNPVSTVIMALEVLKAQDDILEREDRTRIYQTIDQQTQHMLLLLNDLLDYAEFEAGKLLLRLEPLLIGEFLEASVQRHQRLAEAKQIEVIRDGYPTVCIQGDSHRLRQVMDNLVSNAVKFSPPRSSVMITAYDYESHVRVEVLDEGPGIPEEEQAQLFQYFVRLSPQPTAGERSTGLGLGISKAIILAHKGRIGYTRRPEGGSCFYFDLPRE